ncbi:MAG TPA: hypothetical protein VFK10_19390 [Burkholderiaceae bacterium]|nr:hypothetical protein [Burkholderiaceae bacterium]
MIRQPFKLARSRAAKGALSIASALALGCATAQGVPKEGSFEIVNCGSGTNSIVEISKTARFTSAEQVGTTRSMPSGGYLDMTTYHCMSLGITLDGKYTGHAYCEGVDRDGDKYISHLWSTDGGKTSSEVIAGTGKFEGMTRTGTSESLGAFPAIKPGAFAGCGRQTGTYKMK